MRPRRARRSRRERRRSSRCSASFASDVSVVAELLARRGDARLEVGALDASAAQQVGQVAARWHVAGGAGRARRARARELRLERAELLAKRRDLIGRSVRRLEVGDLVLHAVERRARLARLARRRPTPARRAAARPRSWPGCAACRSPRPARTPGPTPRARARRGDARRGRTPGRAARAPRSRARPRGSRRPPRRPPRRSPTAPPRAGAASPRRPVAMRRAASRTGSYRARNSTSFLSASANLHRARSTQASSTHASSS